MAQRILCGALPSPSCTHYAFFIPYRLPPRTDRPDLIFTDKRRAITTDEEWQEVWS